MIYTKVTQTCWFFLYYVYFKRKMYKEAGLHCALPNILKTCRLSLPKIIFFHFRKNIRYHYRKFKLKYMQVKTYRQPLPYLYGLWTDLCSRFVHSFQIKSVLEIMEIAHVETKRGNKAIIVDGYMYRRINVLKNGDN